MTTRKHNLDYDSFLAQCRVFVELMPIYLRCTDRIQGVIREMVELIESPATTEEDRERACGTVAGALLAFARDAEDLPAEKFRLSIPAETKALMGRQRQACAERLKALRDQKGWTQEELAQRSGVGQSAISTIENGQSRPQVGTLVKLAAALGVAKNELWPGVPPVEKKPLGCENGPANGGKARTGRPAKAQ